MELTPKEELLKRLAIQDFKRKWKRSFFRLIGFSIIAIVGFVWFTTSNNKSKFVNPQIYPAFRRIENFSLIYVERDVVEKNAYERCKAVVSKMREEAKGNPEFSPSAQEYYESLKEIGFELPPLYLDTSPTKEELNITAKEQKELLRQQMEIINLTLKKSVQELEYIFKEYQFKVKLKN